MGKASDKRHARRLAVVPEPAVAAEKLRVVKVRDPGLQSLLDFVPEKMIAEDQNYFDDFVERFETAEKSTANLAKARETLKTLKARNEERCRKEKIPAINTPQITTLETWIKVTGKELDKHVGTDTLDLLKFRKLHDNIKALAEKGEKVLKALEHRQEVNEEEIAELGRGYADHFHCLVREGKVARITREQLKAWDRSGKKFHNFGFSWTYKERQPDGAYEECCPDGDECSEHWFWGKEGDDQSVALAKVMIRLANANWKIRNIRKHSGNGTGHLPASKSE